MLQEMITVASVTSSTHDTAHIIDGCAVTNCNLLECVTDQYVSNLAYRADIMFTGVVV